MSNELPHHRSTSELNIYAGLFILLISSYIYGNPIFREMGLTADVVDRILIKMLKNSPVLSSSDIVFKGLSIYFGFLFAWGTIGVKEIKKERLPVFIGYAVGGLLVFLSSYVLFRRPGIIINSSGLYILVNIAAYTLFNVGLSRIFQLYRWRSKLKDLDKFNDTEEEFEQVTEKIGNENSIYIPALYGRTQKRSYWNFVLPFAGTIVTGNPGTGKSFVFINEFIRQAMLNGWSMTVYDYKSGELTDLVYRYMVKYKEKIRLHPNFKDTLPRFSTFDVDRPHQSVRINPLHPSLLSDPADCSDMATLFLESLNRSWIEKKGEFFSASSMALLGALVTFLRYTKLESKKDADGKAIEGNCCSLPHVISLLNSPRDILFSVLANHPKTRIAFSAFVDAVNDGAGEQLSGQVATTKISLSRFATPKIYWAMSGNDCSTFVSDPNDPQYLCLINNEQRRETYGALLSLIIGQVVKKINRPGNNPTLLAVDELATVYVKDIDLLIATARSNKVAVLLGFQDMSQLIKDYGKKVADVVRNTVGNMVSGRVMEETAKSLQETFGKVLQRRHSSSLSNSGVSFSESTQMDYLIPASKISNLSQGEFVMRLADTTTHRLPISYAKGFADMSSLGSERLEHPDNAKYQQLQRPAYKSSEFKDAQGKDITEKMLEDNFNSINVEISQLMEQEFAALLVGPPPININNAVPNSEKNT